MPRMCSEETFDGSGCGGDRAKSTARLGEKAWKGWPARQQITGTSFSKQRVSIPLLFITKSPWLKDLIGHSLCSVILFHDYFYLNLCKATHGNTLFSPHKKFTPTFPAALMYPVGLPCIRQVREPSPLKVSPGHLGTSQEWGQGDIPGMGAKWHQNPLCFSRAAKRNSVGRHWDSWFRVLLLPPQLSMLLGFFCAAWRRDGLTDNEWWFHCKRSRDCSHVGAGALQSGF